jgi:putative FmdB family regulatory protein
MPFYEYECSSCRYYAEVMQKISDKVLKKCPSCGKNTFTKLISAPVFRLKGSGWYETDFKSDKDNKRNLAGGDKEESASKTESTSETGAPAAGDSKSESKTDAKADTKTDAKADTKADAKGDGKSGGKVAPTTPAAGPKAPAPTTRNIASRNVAARAAHGKSAAKRARPAKRKAAKRRGGR